MVHAIKHVFPAHVIVQFNCTNTIKEQCLENVTVMMDLTDAVRGEGGRGKGGEGGRAGGKRGGAKRAQGVML